MWEAILSVSFELDFHLRLKSDVFLLQIIGIISMIRIRARLDFIQCGSGSKGERIQNRLELLAREELVATRMLVKPGYE